MIPPRGLTPEVLLDAYCNGVFPMSEGRDRPDVFWVDPRRRGVFPLGSFHVSRSLARRMRRGGYEIRIDTAFPAVVAACAERDETWINDVIFSLYVSLHHAGFAHSVEVWHDGALAGGVYGVAIQAAFFGESMFSRRTDASKIALAHLVDRLRTGGFRLFDTQFLTPHLASLGAVEITRTAYRAALAEALGHRADFVQGGRVAPIHEVMQRSTQTS